MIESVLTSGVIIIGLSSWLGKVWANRILEKDKLKYTSEIEWIKSKYIQELEKYKVQTEKSVFVHKLQYEKEFGIYIEIWEAVFDLNIKTQQLRPILDYVSPNPEERKIENQKRHEAYGVSYNHFSILINKFSPFYPEEIYDALINLRNTFSKEGISFRICVIEDVVPTDYKKLEASLKKIKEQIEEISKKIRNRTEEMRVLKD